MMTDNIHQHYIISDIFCRCESNFFSCLLHFKNFPNILYCKIKLLRSLPDGTTAKWSVMLLNLDSYFTYCQKDPMLYFPLEANEIFSNSLISPGKVSEPFKACSFELVLWDAAHSRCRKNVRPVYGGPVSTQHCEECGQLLIFGAIVGLQNQKQLNISN